MKPSIFTKIMNGDIPCHKVYEDERTFAFLDINPVQPGHTLVVPRAQVDHIEELEEEDFLALMHTAKLLAQNMRDELQVERVCMKVEGFEVPHAHIHLIPCETIDDFRSEPYEAGEDELLDMTERLLY
ncbi:MAG: HIT family protein [Candidatus Saccharimonadales bacterium]|jgi:histidine triad (HIT) family protein